LIVSCFDLITIIFLVLMYALSLRRARKLHSEHKAFTEEFLRRLLFIPLVFFFIHSWDIVFRLLELFYQDAATYSWLIYPVALFQPMQGLSNFVLFVCMSSSVRKILFSKSKPLLEIQSH
jgi:hypothetical protein